MNFMGPPRLAPLYMMQQRHVDTKLFKSSACVVVLINVFQAENGRNFLLSFTQQRTAATTRLADSQNSTEGEVRDRGVFFT